MNTPDITRHLISEAVYLNSGDEKTIDLLEQSLRDKRVQAFLEWLCSKEPDLQIRWKLESWIWKFLPSSLRNRSVRSRGRTIWLPDPREMAQCGPLDLVGDLGHEGTHIIDGSVLGWDAFLIGYAFPQVLALPFAMLTIVSFFLGINLTATLLTVLTALSLLPWPSPVRANMEAKAYACNLAVARVIFGPSSVEYSEARQEIVSDLSSWMYWKMIWRKKVAENYDKWIEGAIVSQRPSIVSSVLPVVLSIVDK